MTAIIPYGGVNEIGGNKILLLTEDGKFFLDFGLSFDRQQELFSEYMEPRTAKGVGDYLDSGLLPRVEGIYRKDLLEPVPELSYQEPSIDGVLLSHAHLDHCGLISLINRRIPVFCSLTTKKIMKSTTEIKSGIDTELTKVKLRPYGQYVSSYTEKSRRFEDFSDVSGIEVEAYPVDHSTHGCRAFIIHTPDGIIAYTGDLRLHGPRSNLTEKYLERLEDSDIDLLLTEGTRVGKEEPDEAVLALAGELHEKLNTEEEVEERCVDLITETREPVFLDFAKRDFDRLLTFHKVARKTGRRLVIPTDLAYYADKLGEPSFLEKAKSGLHEEATPGRPDTWIGIDSRDDDLIIHIRRKCLSAYDKREYYNWEEPYLDQGNARKCDWIKKNLSDLIVFVGFWHLQELFDLKPEGGMYIHSASEPFNEEKAINFKKLKNWLELFGLTYEYMHTSGHLSKNEVFELCERAVPGKIVPIHTEDPKIFERVFDNAVIPQKEKGISV